MHAPVTAPDGHAREENKREQTPGGSDVSTGEVTESSLLLSIEEQVAGVRRAFAV